MLWGRGRKIQGMSNRQRIQKEKLFFIDGFTRPLLPDIEEQDDPCSNDEDNGKDSNGSQHAWGIGGKRAGGIGLRVTALPI